MHTVVTDSRNSAPRSTVPSFWVCLGWSRALFFGLPASVFDLHGSIFLAVTRRDARARPGRAGTLL